jgi:hypothetical protein
MIRGESWFPTIIFSIKALLTYDVVLRRQTCQSRQVFHFHIFLLSKLDL